MTRICTYSLNGNNLVGICAGSKVIDLNEALRDLQSDFRAASVKELLAAGAAGVAAAKLAAKVNIENRNYVHDLSEVRLLAPIPDPGKFLCLAGNYAEHLAENYGKENVTIPTDIHIFVKSNTSVIGPYDNVVVPKSITKLDYELELGIVIGKQGRYIPENCANNHIAGYFVANDLSDRAYMPKIAGGRIHWYAMKAQDNLAPFGPCVLLKDDVESIAELNMKIYVNGELRQEVNPKTMIFKPEWIVSRISSWVTLLPGDVIITGTPAGNAWSRRQFLQDGDVVEAVMDKVGGIKNKIVFEEAIYRF